MHDCDEQNYVSSRYTLRNDIDMKSVLSGEIWFVVNF